MALSPVEVKQVVDLHLKGYTPYKIAKELDLSPHTTARYVNDPAIVGQIVPAQERYIDRLLRGRDKALDRLLDQLDNDITITTDEHGEQTVSSLPVELLNKLFAQLDASIERNHKIAVGYFTADKLRLWQECIARIIQKHVTDPDILRAIATEIMEFNPEL